MGVRVLQPANHKCFFDSSLENNKVVQCDECGRIWIGRAPGNPRYNAWRPVPRWWAKFKGWI